METINVKPRRTKVTTLAAGRFLRLDLLTYVDRTGHTRQWEAASRQATPGAVFMVSTLHPSERLLFIRQYRPPVDAHVIEFPAGLINEGEEPTAAGIRELREETGYQGVFRWLSPMALSSPGMTSEAVALGLVDIDEEQPVNRDPMPCPDTGEDIEVLPVRLADVPAFLRERIRAGDRVDSRVTAYLMGLNVLW